MSSGPDEMQAARRTALLDLGLGAVAAATRIYTILAVLPRPFDTENMRAGFSLAARGVMADPFILPTGPTAHVAPLYPSLIAACINVVGSQELGFLVARLVLAIIFGAFIALLPTLAVWVGMQRRSGLVAAALFVLPTPPVFMWIEATGQHETVLSTVLFAVASCYSIKSIRTDRPTPRAAAVVGVTWGIAAHSTPVVLPAFLALLGWSILSRAYPVASRGKQTLIAVFAFAAITTPWSIRNHRVIGGSSFIRDNFGLELAVSNTDSASPDMQRNSGGMNRHPFYSRDEAIRMARVGERAYYRSRGEEATRWIREHPRRFVELTAQRIFLFFLPESGRRHHGWFYFPLVAGTIVGFWRLASRDRWLAYALALILLAYASPHFLVQSSPRYSYPVLWLLTLVSVDSLRLPAFFRRRARLVPPPAIAA